MCTYPWPFEDDLALWDTLGLRQAGLLQNKIGPYGYDATAAALRERGITATTLITGNFTLADPATWDATRATIREVIDLAAAVGGVPYFTPGPGDGRPASELAAVLAEAVAPCVAYAADRGVRLAIEPTLRPDRSFVHTLGEGAKVAETAGLDLVADLGNCWAEPDLADTIRQAAPAIAVVQLADVVTQPGPPPPGDRAVPGDGILDIVGFVRAAVAAGYAGPFELEIVGPRIAAEGYGEATARAVRAATALLQEVLP
jgi:sugar phosphate isomerase/epimerase